MHSGQGNRIPEPVADHGAGRTVCGVVGEDVGSRREDGLIELDVVVVDIEIRDRVRAEMRPEEVRIRTVAAGQRIALSTDQDIGAISA